MSMHEFRCVVAMVHSCRCHGYRLAMAEAHSAVAFSFAVSHEGVHINVNHDALWAVWESGVRSWKKKIGHVKVSAKYPSLCFE